MHEGEVMPYFLMMCRGGFCHIRDGAAGASAAGSSFEPHPIIIEATIAEQRSKLMSFFFIVFVPP